MDDPSRKFIYVETAFFWRWWLQQDDQMHHTVHRLVKEGQILRFSLIQIGFESFKINSRFLSRSSGIY